jgi:hypothetical protein
MGEERRADEPDALSVLSLVDPPVFRSEHTNHPLARPEIARHDREEGALAATVGPYERPVLPAVYAKANVFEDRSLELEAIVTLDVKVHDRFGSAPLWGALRRRHHAHEKQA